MSKNANFIIVLKRKDEIENLDIAKLISNIEIFMDFQRIKMCNRKLIIAGKIQDETNLVNIFKEFECFLSCTEKTRRVGYFNGMRITLSNKKLKV